MRLIDADQLLQKLQKDPLFPFVEEYGITRVIEAAPTIEAEPTRHGHWNPWRCSKCGGRAPIHWDGEIRSYAEWRAPYCPSCGAKMDEEEQT